MKDFTIELLSDYRYRPSHAWVRWNNHQSKYLTDGHILLRTKYVIKPLKRMVSERGHATYESLPLQVKTKSMDRIFDRWDPTFQPAEVGETVRCKGPNRKYRSCTVLIHHDSGCAVVSADKLKLVMNKVKNPTFYLNPENTKNESVWIKSGRALVGCMMPMRI